MRKTQPFVVALTGYALYVALVCPCVNTLSCHLTEYYCSILLAATLVAWENRQTIF